MRFVRNGPFTLLIGPNPRGGHSRNGHYGGRLLAGWRRQITFAVDEIDVGEDGNRDEDEVVVNSLERSCHRKEEGSLAGEYSVLKGLKGASIKFPPKMAHRTPLSPRGEPHMAAPIQPQLAVVPTTSSNVLNKIAGKNTPNACACRMLQAPCFIVWSVVGTTRSIVINNGRFLEHLAMMRRQLASWSTKHGGLNARDSAHKYK